MVTILFLIVLISPSPWLGDFAFADSGIKRASQSRSSWDRSFSPSFPHALSQKYSSPPFLAAALSDRALSPSSSPLPLSTPSFPQTFSLLRFPIHPPFPQSFASGFYVFLRKHTHPLHRPPPPPPSVPLHLFVPEALITHGPNISPSPSYSFPLFDNLLFRRSCRECPPTPPSLN